MKFYLEQCLLSLQRALSGVDAEIYVVDNHSGDGSVEFIASRFPNVNLISSNHNLGFSRANNMAIRQSCGEYVLLLNPDTIVAEHTIQQVLSFMDEHQQSGGVGVCMLRDNGEPAMESRRGLPTPMTAFYKMSGLCRRYPKHKRFGHYYMGDLPWDKPVRIEVMSGAFCMLRRSALEAVGLLDEDFFMYGEDIDLSYRLLKGGYENWYLPAPILHYKGESMHKSSFRYVHVFYDAMLIFFRKHYGGMSHLVSLPIKIAIYVKAVMALVSMQMASVRKSLGFVLPRHNVMPHYLFIGSHETIAKCKKIAKHKGLDASFVEGNSVSLPNGHVDLTLPDVSWLYIVYDTDVYSYERIFSIFAKHSKSGVLMATYNPSTSTIITGGEVIE